MLLIIHWLQAAYGADGTIPAPEIHRYRIYDPCFFEIPSTHSYGFKLRAFHILRIDTQAQIRENERVCREAGID